MSFFNLFAGYSTFSILALGFMAFTAGFIDSIVGGGGLIQLPALLINLPNTPIPTVLGTNKIAGFSGTSVAAYHYARRQKFNYKLLITISIFSAIASYLGVLSLSYINVSTLKPMILVILIVIAIYSFVKKDLGSVQTKALSLQKQILFGSLIGIAVGFYDGFFGPATGSFLLLGFVVVLGFDFVTASAYSKIINGVTNISALIVFIRQGNYVLEFAILMSACNIIGSFIGSRLALKRGNNFVRVFFLVIVAIMIVTATTFS